MAKFNSAFKFTGSLGDVSGVKRHDSPETYLRLKAGPTRDMVKNGSNFARTRENNSQFSGCSSTVKEIRRSLTDLLDVSDSRVTNRLMKICSALQKADINNARGQRAILFSKFGMWLNDFELNLHTALNSVIKISNSTVVKLTSSAQIVIPTLIPGLNFSNPWKQPKYRIMATLSTVPDMVYRETGYAPENVSGEFELKRASFFTEFLGSNLVYPGSTINLQLNNFTPNASTNLLLAVGVQFGNDQPVGTVPAKRAACGKILAIV